MTQIPSQLEPITKKDVPSFFMMLTKLWQRLAIIINGQLSFGDGTNLDNILGSWQNFVTTGPNTDILLTHNLGHVPVGYLLVEKSASVDLYTGSAPGNAKLQINLRATVSGVTVRVFIF